MTVGELLADLQRLLDRGEVTPETPVLSEGCDCQGNAGSLWVIDCKRGYYDDATPEERDEEIPDENVPHLLVARERRKPDTGPPPPPPPPPPIDPATRTFTTT